MFFILLFVSVIVYQFERDKPQTIGQQIIQLLKLFSHKNSVLNRGAMCLKNTFINDIFLLLSHCLILFVMNNIDDFHLIMRVLLLEVCFYFSDFAMRIFSFKVNYGQHLLRMLIIYLVDVFLVFSAYIFQDQVYSIQIMLFIHAILLVLLIMRYLRRKRYAVLLKDVEDCIPVKLKENEEINTSLNSAENHTKQHYIIQKNNKFQLILVSTRNNKDPIPSIQLIQTQNKQTRQTSSQDHTQMHIFKQIATDEKQIAHDTMGDNKWIQQQKINEKQGIKEEESICQEVLKMGELPNFQPCGDSHHSIHSMRGISSPVTNNITQADCNIMNLLHKTQIESLNFNQIQCKNDLIQPNSVQKNQQCKNIPLQFDDINVEILNTLEIDKTIKDTYHFFKLVNFNEKTQQLMIQDQLMLMFYSVPEFIIIKQVRLDSNSKYLFHSSLPICIQYHFNSPKFIFTRIDLSLNKITIKDMKYQSITILNSIYQDQSLLYFGTFGTNDQQQDEIIFARDGEDLLAVNVQTGSTENYSHKLPSDESKNVVIDQLNKRQIVINQPNYHEIKKIIIDVPTNICYKIITELPMNAILLPIQNLQNQVILNLPLTRIFSAVYDLNTRTILELPFCFKISKAWLKNRHLYIIDDTFLIKVFDLTCSEFNLVPPSDNGISCVSIAFS